MTFPPKFARRVTALRAAPPHCAMLAALALTLACSSSLLAWVVPPGEGMSEDSLVTSIEWTATGGTIGLDGTYSSPSTGDFKVVGKRPGSNWTLSDTANVTVVAPQPTLTTVIASPKPATATASSRETFGAVGRLSDGSAVPIGVTWAATGGTIDPGGVYTAGQTLGKYQVIARAASANVADTVPVTITTTRNATPGDPVLLPTPRDKDHGNRNDGSKAPSSGLVRERIVQGHIKTPEAEGWIEVTDRWWRLELVLVAALLASAGVMVQRQRLPVERLESEWLAERC